MKTDVAAIHLRLDGTVNLRVAREVINASLYEFYSRIIDKVISRICLMLTHCRTLVTQALLLATTVSFV